MDWFNYYGLIIVAVIMIPNIVFAIKIKDGFKNKVNGKVIETVEQIGRFGSFAFMIFNIPGTYFGFWFDKAIVVYVAVNIVLVTTYCVVWIVCFKKSSLFRALALSIIPSVMFLFCGIMICSIPLIAASVLFAPSHIAISYKNANVKK